MWLTQRTSRHSRARSFRPQVERLEERATPATLPEGFVEAFVADGLSAPTAMELGPAGKLFITEQGGTMEVWKDGIQLQPNFFANTPLTVSSAGERGLLGVAFDPDYATNHFVYVYYTATGPVHNRVSRFVADADPDADYNLALAGSETVILELNNLSSATNHNGGAIHFGPDGKLYIAVGDNANGANAQTLNNLLGKMLRINADGTIPGDNPFFNTATGNNRAIWALGLRNPFTFAFSANGRMHINDVGAATWEEINVGVAGANYGWPGKEGPFTPPIPNPQLRTAPIYAYRHSGGSPTGCAITGGTFYNPQTSQFPEDWVGDYFFSDFCGGWIYRYDIATDSVTEFARGINNPVDLRTGSDGALYYLARQAHKVFRITAAEEAPEIVQQPLNRSAAEDSDATFAVSAVGALPLEYQWQRLISGSWTDIVGATNFSYTLGNVQTTDNGAQFRVLVTNTEGDVTSNAATLTVFINQPPTASIISPKAGKQYTAGAKYTFQGTASDFEDGTLPADAFTWWVDFHHDDGDAHVHPFLLEQTGNRIGSITIPNQGETSANVFYRIHLRVQDNNGLTFTTFRDLTPLTSQITLQSNVAGLQLSLDEQPQDMPLTVTSVVGMRRTLGAELAPVLNGITYTFQKWSDNGAASHAITTSTSNKTYTANYFAEPSTTGLRINFQPAGRPIPAGYLADTGELFGDRGNGEEYGWLVNSNQSNARDRNQPRSPDQRYDTLQLMPAGAVWEIVVPDGGYQVHVVAGDPAFKNSHYQIMVEDQFEPVIDSASTASYWFHGIATVNVSDGRLTISSGAGASNNKIAFIEINALPAPVAPPQSAPQVPVDPPASRSAPVAQTSNHWAALLALLRAKRAETLHAIARIKFNLF